MHQIAQAGRPDQRGCVTDGMSGDVERRDQRAQSIVEGGRSLADDIPELERVDGAADSVTDRGCARLPTTTLTVSEYNWSVMVTLPSDCSKEPSWTSKPSAVTIIECGPGPRPQKEATPDWSVCHTRSPMATLAPGIDAGEGSRT